MRTHVAMGGPLSVFVLGVVVVLLGCDRGPQLPPMAKVTGTVTLDGKPLPAGRIEFVPNRAKGASPGPPAVASIDENGHFALTTARVEGAIVGWHRVRVAVWDLAGIQDPKSGRRPAPAVKIPFRYDNLAKSGLEFEVKANQENQFNVALTSQDEKP